MIRIAILVAFGFFALWPITSSGQAQDASTRRAVQYEREGWDTDFASTRIDLIEIRDGGPPRDGIPSIDDPRFEPVRSETALAGREPVIALTLGGKTRAYPVRILMFHEIVNDVLGEVPVAVTYCPLCNSAIVFDRRLEGRTLEFGTTGKLRKSDLVMYDRQTETWWQQFTGEGLVGALAGQSLSMIPTGLISWADFKARHPMGEVLQPPADRMRDYGRNPYAQYDGSQVPFLYRGDMPPGIGPMERVVVVRDGDGAPVRAISMNALRKAGMVERGGYRLVWNEGQASALDAERIAEGRDVGSVTATSPSGKDAIHEVTFAFVAHAFYPEVVIER